MDAISILDAVKSDISGCKPVFGPLEEVKRQIPPMLAGSIFEEVLVLQSESDLDDIANNVLRKNPPGVLNHLMNTPNFLADVFQCTERRLVAG